MKAPGRVVVFRRRPSAGWWPARVPAEGVGRYLRTVRFRSGAVMAQIELVDGRTVWVPDSPRFTEFEIVA